MNAGRGKSLGGSNRGENVAVIHIRATADTEGSCMFGTARTR